MFWPCPGAVQSFYVQLTSSAQPHQSSPASSTPAVKRVKARPSPWQFGLTRRQSLGCREEGKARAFTRLGLSKNAKPIPGIHSTGAPLYAPPPRHQHPCPSSQAPHLLAGVFQGHRLGFCPLLKGLLAVVAPQGHTEALEPFSRNLQVVVFGPGTGGV